jgi:hypothetical protein
MPWAILYRRCGADCDSSQGQEANHKSKSLVSKCNLRDIIIVKEIEKLSFDIPECSLTI